MQRDERLRLIEALTSYLIALLLRTHQTASAISAASNGDWLVATGELGETR
jgi:thiamine monophosphate kinase